MFSRNVSLHLKPKVADEFTRTMEKEIIPLLRKQNGFQDEITLVAPDSRDVVAISLWDRKEDAEAYAREAYPAVLKTLAKVLDGTPKVESYEVGSSTYHKITARS